jgi:hypothetical protein
MSFPLLLSLKVSLSVLTFSSGHPVPSPHFLVRVTSGCALSCKGEFVLYFRLAKTYRRGISDTWCDVLAEWLKQ